MRIGFLLPTLILTAIAVRRGGTLDLLAQLDQFAKEPAGHAANETWQPPTASDLRAMQRHADAIIASSVTAPSRPETLTTKIDAVVLHPIAGLLILLAVLFVIFQAVFSWAAPLQDAVSAGVAWLGKAAGTALPAGPLHSLVVDGVFAGVGTVVEFLPQILILFLFILSLEESGYLPRAAFLLDRVMFKAGLSGRSFIPLLSSFACAIPGIMATRSIQDPRDRLATIMVAPLMTCSARLPVYTLLIGAFIPRRHVAGVFNLQGLVLFALYVAGILSALLVAWTMKKWRRDRGEHALMLELPSYRMPHPRDLAIGLWERGAIFLKRVGGIILALTVLLWFLASFPAPPAGATLPAIDYSYAGRIGRAMQAVFAPVGFNWQICIALIPGLAAREVAVASLATVYALSAANDDIAAAQLGPLIAAHWSLGTALSLLVWYIYAPQCISTLATIRRETRSWKQVGIAAGYLFAMAYAASLATYQATRLLAGG